MFYERRVVDCLGGSEVFFGRGQRVTREAMAQSLMRSLNRAAEQRGEECFTPWEAMSSVDRESAALVAVEFAREIGVPVVDEGQRSGAWVPWPTHAGRWWVYCAGPWDSVVECLVRAYDASGDLIVKDESDFCLSPSDLRKGTVFLDARLTPPEAP